MDTADKTHRRVFDDTKITVFVDPGELHHIESVSAEDGMCIVRRGEPFEVTVEGLDEEGNTLVGAGQWGVSSKDKLRVSITCTSSSHIVDASSLQVSFADDGRLLSLWATLQGPPRQKLGLDITVNNGATSFSTTTNVILTTGPPTGICVDVVDSIVVTHGKPIGSETLLASIVDDWGSTVMGDALPAGAGIRLEAEGKCELQQPNAPFMFRAIDKTTGIADFDDAVLCAKGGKNGGPDKPETRGKVQLHYATEADQKQKNKSIDCSDPIAVEIMPSAVATELELRVVAENVDRIGEVYVDM